MAYFSPEQLRVIQNYRFIMYTRKSSRDNEDKQVRSLAGQREDLEDLVNRLHLKITEKLEESRSAFTPGRPSFERMLELIREG